MTRHHAPPLALASAAVGDVEGVGIGVGATDPEIVGVGVGSGALLGGPAVVVVGGEARAATTGQRCESGSRNDVNRTAGMRPPR
jgi:hypothetical protein